MPVSAVSRGREVTVDMMGEPGTELQVSMLSSCTDVECAVKWSILRAGALTRVTPGDVVSCAWTMDTAVLESETIPSGSVVWSDCSVRQSGSASSSDWL